jgi:hypothetical protein
VNWKALLRRPTFWIDLALAATLLIFALRAQAQSSSPPTPEQIETHVEFDDVLLKELARRVDGINDKVQQMYGMGIAASALAMGSVVIQIRKAK